MALWVETARGRGGLGSWIGACFGFRGETESAAVGCGFVVFTWWSPRPLLRGWWPSSPRRTRLSPCPVAGVVEHVRTSTFVPCRALAIEG